MTMLVMVGIRTGAQYLKKPGRNRIRVRLFVRTVEENLRPRYFRFRCWRERREIGRFSLKKRVSVGMK